MHDENENFTVTMICSHIFQNNCESDSKMYKASNTDKKVTPYVNVQLWFKSCLCF